MLQLLWRSEFTYQDVSKPSLTGCIPRVTLAETALSRKSVRATRVVPKGTFNHLT